jgi:L-arabinose transport system substrate-binding protein
MQDPTQFTPARRARRTMIATALALVAAGGLAACGSSSDGGSGGTSTGGGAKAEDLKFAYLAKQADAPYFVEQLNAAKAKAQELGVELTTQDLQLDTGLALDSLDTVISQGTDGVVIVVPDQEIGPAVMRKAQSAGVPLIASDDVIEDADGRPAPYVGLDNAAVGGQVGRALSDLYAAAPWRDDVETIGIAAVELRTLDVCNERTEGAKRAFFDANPDFPAGNVVSVPYDGSTNRAIDAMTTTITGNSQYDRWLIWSCNDAGVQGAVRALERADVPVGDAIGVGLDGSLSCDEFNRGDSSFAASIFLDPRKEGETSVQELYDFHVRGTPIPERVDFPGTLIDRRNAADVVPGCR